MEFLPLVGIVLLFWLFIIRPASKRQKELGRMQSSLSEGDEVVLTSGIFGTVSHVDDDHLRVVIADGVDIKVARGAIGSKVQRPDETDEADEADDAGDEQADTEAENGRPGTGPEGN
ncbi:preprotein translocase subunit YajC [Nocardioides sp. YIM 152315]|uniref:preprotein translocase subunit YajC n=1 Tax=Nocardioides sp. YIM 152315 TaxID=3031760 RepID=UPI0023DBFBBA|nr:preprotein translocase subunit YajC [Nocardioides sp. YIM 152315]MDF1605585.1 preprotein translocase subunit YajC [Nocardioides sp. YIM 152315]